VRSGVVPETDFLKGSGLNMSERGFVIVNKVRLYASLDVVATTGLIRSVTFAFFVSCVS